MEWTRGHVLGRGSSATVSTATSTSGKVFAVKSVDFSHSNILKKEQHFLSMLNSPYVITYKGCDITIEDNKTMYNIHMDYMRSGSIMDVINRQNGKGLTGLEIERYTRDIVRGLEYIHSKNVVHCDIKSRNVMVDGNGAKIGDFGCAKWAGEVGPVSGTPMFMGPEVARGEEQGFGSDIWALGCTIIEMATGCAPWLNINNPVSILYKIAFSNEMPEIPDELCDQGKDFVRKCLVRDPRQRWTAKQLLKHPYIRQQDNKSKEPVSEKMFTNSPTSILDQDVWDSINDSSFISCTGNECDRSNYVGNLLRQRIKQLVCTTEMMPNWVRETGETEWVSIRMNGDGGSAAVTGGRVGGLRHEWR